MWEIEGTEEKTGSVNFMVFFIDSTDPEVDAFHSMAFYFIIQGGRHKSYDEHNFVFHVLKLYAGGGGVIR